METRLLPIRGVTKSHPHLTRAALEMTRYCLEQRHARRPASPSFDVQNRMVDFGDRRVLAQPRAVDRAGAVHARGGRAVVEGGHRPTGSTCSRTSIEEAYATRSWSRPRRTTRRSHQVDGRGVERPRALGDDVARAPRKKRRRAPRDGVAVVGARLDRRRLGGRLRARRLRGGDVRPDPARLDAAPGDRARLEELAAAGCSTSRRRGRAARRGARRARRRALDGADHVQECAPEDLALKRDAVRAARRAAPRRRPAGQLVLGADRVVVRRASSRAARAASSCTPATRRTCCPSSRSCRRRSPTRRSSSASTRLLRDAGMSPVRVHARDRGLRLQPAAGRAAARGLLPRARRRRDGRRRRPRGARGPRPPLGGHRPVRDRRPQHPRRDRRARASGSARPTRAWAPSAARTIRGPPELVEHVDRRAPARCCRSSEWDERVAWRDRS